MYKEALDYCERIAESGHAPELAGRIGALKLDAFAGLGRWRELVALGSTLIAGLASNRESETLGRVHGLTGFAYLRLGEIRLAERHLRAAIHVYTWDLDDLPAALRQQRRLGLLYLNMGLLRQSCSEMETAIEISDRNSCTPESGILRVNLAVAMSKLGTLERVPGYLDEADEFLRSASRKKWLLLSSLVRANYLRITGHLTKALELLVPSLQMTREQNYSREEAIALEYIGDCHLAKREYKQALEQYEGALKIAEATAPDGDLIPELSHRMGETLIRLGDPNTAILLCERGFRVARALGDRYEECATHRVYAMAHRAAGNPKRALRIIDEGIDLGRQYEIPYELGRALTWAGETRLQELGPDEQAHGRQQLWEARAIFERMGLLPWVRSVDRLLGFESQSETTLDQPNTSAVDNLGDLDRGALRFGIVTCNRKVREAVEILQSVAPSQIPVLITGESGVGKELLAQALHQMGPRRKEPFVPVNCGAISVNLLDSEFFGHERGAFTGAVSSREGLLASSHKGTLFLDEVGELPSQVQAALLRVLETGELRAVGRDDVRKIELRIVAATNTRLEDLVDRGLFRQDLFYRLNGIRVTIPPLREREEDIRALFRYFWSQATTTAKKRLTIEDGVETVLCAYDWPGNVRELRHEIARVVALAPDTSLVRGESFLPQIQRKDIASLRRDRERRDEVAEERLQILSALRAHRGNKAEAARSLGGMKRTTLIYKIERLGIRPDEYQVRE